MALPALLLSTNLACSNPPTETDRPGATGEPTASTGSTGDTAPSTPGPISASCLPTENALRFDCAITTDPPRAVQIRYARADGTGPERVRADPVASVDHRVLVWFLEPDSDYAFTAETTDDGPPASVEGAFHTGLVPGEARAELSVRGTSSVPLVGTNDPCTGRPYAVVFDTGSGAMVWYDLVDDDGTLGLLQMVQFTEQHTVLANTNHSVVEVDLGGAVLHRLISGVDYDLFLHHDLFEHAGAYWLLFEEDGLASLNGFAILDPSGAELAEWDPEDHLAIPSDPGMDWMHINTIDVDDQLGVYLSSYRQSSVLKIDGDRTSPTFGTVEWSMAGGPGSDFGQDWTIDWSAIPGPHGFLEQHDVHRLPDGRMVMLDNGHGRALVLTLDEQTRAARVVRAYPTDEAACGPQGTAAVSSSGDVFAGCATGSLREYRPGGERVWDATPVCYGFAQAVRFYPLEGW